MLVSEIIARVRNDLGDEADLTAVSDTTVVYNSVLAKLGKVPDAQLGTTTAATVNAESVIHYAQWSNSGPVTGTDGNINASVQLASSTNMLATYAADGIKTIKGMRPDAIISGNLSGGFQTALNLYVLARCLEGEVETDAGNGGYKTFYEQFVQAVSAVPPHVSDAAISNFISLGTSVIAARRPDLGLCNATLSLLENFVMLQAAQTKGNPENLQPNFTSFYSELDKIPHHYTDAELLMLLHDSIRDIFRLRSDARMDEYGYEITVAENEPALTGVWPLRDVFAKAAEYFCAAGAIASRIGEESGADVKCQLWEKKYHEQIGIMR